MRLALLVSYDGANYRGWTDLRDLALRPALAKVLRLDDESPPLLQAASRTDAGVHAAGQVCSLTLDDSSGASSSSANIDCGQIAYSLNQLLPAAISVRVAKVVDDGFDVRANSGKTYVYRLSTRAGSRDPLRRLYEWHQPPRRGQSPWDAAAVSETAMQLCGTHSFAAFGNRPRGGERNVEVDPICTLSELRLEEAASGDGFEVDDSSGLWRFTVRGDRFLYKQVRNMVGALVKVGYGELSTEEVLEARETGKFARGDSIPLTAPAHGLTLQRVEYESDPFAMD